MKALLFIASACEIIGTSIDSLALSAHRQHLLLALLAVYIPLSHYVHGKMTE